MRWNPVIPGATRPLSDMDVFLDALAAQVEQLAATVAAQAAEIAALNAKAGL